MWFASDASSIDGGTMDKHSFVPAPPEHDQQDDSKPRSGDDKASPTSERSDEASEATRFEERVREILMGVVRTLDMEHKKFLHMQLHEHVAPVSSMQSTVAPPAVDALPLPEEGPDGEVILCLDDAAPFQPSNTTSTGVSKANRNAFKLLRAWTEEVDTASLCDADLGDMNYNAQLSLLLSKSGSGPILVRNTSASVKCTMRPTHPFRLVWDALAAFFLLYDLCVIPMQVFDHPTDGIILVVATLVLLFWTFDIVGNFFVAYQLPEGEVEHSSWRVARHYCRTWFCPDLLIVALDWVILGPQLFSGSSSQHGLAGSAGIIRIGKLARFLRLMRVLRVIRFGKLQALHQHVLDLIGLESTAITLCLLKNLMVIIFINHWVACAWYGVGLLHEDTGWLVGRRVPVEKGGWFDNYLLSLFWSICNFTPGSSDIRPETREEFIFSVLVLFFALFVFTVLVSSTTSLISRLMGLQSVRGHQLWVLKGFLLHHKVPHLLRSRVLRYVNAALGSQKEAFHRRDVELLELLSEPLLEEVQMSLHVNTLRVHPFFRVLPRTRVSLMKKISAEALKQVSFSRGDVIFSIGEEIEKMCFVVSGVLHYDPLHRAKNSRALVAGGDHFCEAVLWTRWHTRGTMHADADCELLDLNSAAFCKVVKRQPLFSVVVQEYAKAFVQVLNMAGSGALSSPLSDLQASYLGEGEDLLNVLAAMER